MSRYIDADKLLTDELTHTLPIGCGRSSGRVVVFVDDIEKQPTADLVEVVRCKDCKYYKANCCFNPQWDFESSVEIPLVRETDFCSYGERREK